MPDQLSIYVLPPLLSLAVGLLLAGLALFKGQLKIENALFALVCLWWTLLAPVFISHHLIDDPGTLLAIERGVHFFYTYLPLVCLLFVHRILGIKRNYLLIISGLLCFLFSLTTVTDYYIQGLHHYSWGYIARGGIAFQLFGVYGMLALVYIIYCLFENLKHESDRMVRLRNKYMIFAFVALGILTLLNLPAINGIDLYPAGNFSFVPLSVLAYGILRYRLLDVRSFLHLSVVWVVLSSIILLPNIVIFILLQPRFASIDPALLFAIFAGWFVLNHFYFIKIQPLVNQRLFQIKFRLRLLELEFNEEILDLIDADFLIGRIKNMLKKALEIDSISVFQRIENSANFIGPFGYQFKLGDSAEKLLLKANHLVDRQIVERSSYYSLFREKLLKAFDLLGARYMVPVFQHGRLLALFLISEPSGYLRIGPEESRFINNIMAAASAELSDPDKFPRPSAGTPIL